MMLENFYDTGKKTETGIEYGNGRLEWKKKESGKRKAIIAHPVENENDKFINIHTFFLKSISYAHQFNIKYLFTLWNLIYFSKIYGKMFIS